MPNPYVTSGALIGFKVGTQTNVNDLIVNGGAVHGTFYLAQDTHRLYVGNEDTTLSPVNEGIVTVATISDLPSFTTAAIFYVYIMVEDGYKSIQIPMIL